MELTEKLQVEIAAVFKTVQYGRITFYLSPDKKTLDYSVETTGKLTIDERLNKPGMRLTEIKK